MLPEFAAWRYGDVFRTRRRKASALMGLAIVAPIAYVALTVSGAAAAMGLGTLMSIAFSTYNLRGVLRKRLIVRGAEGRLLRLSEQDTWGCRVMVDPDGAGWWLSVAHRRRMGRGRLWQSFTVGDLTGLDSHWSEFSGEAAQRALATILPSVNKGGADAKQVREAVELVTNVPDANRLLTGGASAGRRSDLVTGENYLTRLAPSFRLALEMSLHEADERAALEGELHVLEARWREAEEIAAISDGMFLPSNIDERLDRLRKR